MSCRVVLDTNCIVSALVFSKQSMALLRHGWQSGEIIPLVNKETANELLKVLAYPKFNLSQEEQALLLADFCLMQKRSPGLICHWTCPQSETKPIKCFYLWPWLAKRRCW